MSARKLIFIRISSLGYELSRNSFVRVISLSKKLTAKNIDPYHAAAVSAQIKIFVFARRQASARREFSARLAVQQQSFLCLSIPS